MRGRWVRIALRSRADWSPYHVSPCVAPSYGVMLRKLQLVSFASSSDDISNHCTVLYCTVLYCTVLYCTVLYCTVLYCTVPYRTSRVECRWVEVVKVRALHSNVTSATINNRSVFVNYASGESQKKFFICDFCDDETFFLDLFCQYTGAKKVEFKYRDRSVESCNWTQLNPLHVEMTNRAFPRHDCYGRQIAAWRCVGNELCNKRVLN